MAAEAQAEVQALLRFLTQDAKVPLAVALPKYNLLRKHGLSTPDAISKSDPDSLKPIFQDEKITKQVFSAAKRVSNPRKRAAGAHELPSSPSKQGKTNIKREACHDEASLALPETQLSMEELQSVVIETNRAPLMLAFALIVSRYTLSGQPLSSRLSLAQAVTSAGARSKAKHIGLTDSSPEDEGWAEGQPKVRLMGRDVAVMRRHILITTRMNNSDSQETLEGDSSVNDHEAFWGIDLEALKRSNGPLIADRRGSGGPPTHKPEAARSYLLRSMDVIEDVSPPVKQEPDENVSKSKTTSNLAKAERRERAVAMLLKSIDHVCSTWAMTLSSEELDRRASTWYTKVRPEVAQGQSGWGQRGNVALQAIIDLARTT